jgi:hypothetical protein
MRSREFITKSVTGQDVLSYIQQTHHEPLTAQLSQAVLQQPEWELRSVPLQDLHIPDQGYDDDPDYEPAADPYNRVQDIDPEHAGEVSIHNVDRKPIVIDREGFIIDGNHRAWAAAELMGRDTIQAWVPVEQELTEIGNTRIDYQPNRKRKNSLFHTTVDRHWVDVFFDRSFTGTLQITFTVDQNYKSSIQLPQGTVFRIFSTVLQIIKEQLPEYMRKARPPKVSFTAEGGSRVSLYRRMFVPVVTDILGPRWRLTEYPGNQHLFIWEPVKKNEKNPTRPTDNLSVVPVERIKEDDQVLDEYSDHDSGIKKALEKKGYKFLGVGIDQMAYLEPSTGYVLKIFGTRGGKDFSQDQKMFFKFAKFCMEHQDNPFLPRFYGYESFEFKGNTYLQIRTEQLFKNKKLQQAVTNVSSAYWLISDREKNIVMNAVKTPARYELLKSTLEKLYAKGTDNNYQWDLRPDNIMVRKDGTPVINDPWVVPL